MSLATSAVFISSLKEMRKKRVMLKLVIFTNDEGAHYRSSSFSSNES